MRRYTEQDLEHYEHLVDQARERIARQQAIIENLSDRRRLDDAFSVLESLSETLVLYEEERVRILEALSK